MYRQSKKSAQKKIEYKAYEKVLESVIRQAKNMYYNDTITAAGSDSRKLWGVIKEVLDRKQTKHKIPHYLMTILPLWANSWRTQCQTHQVMNSI